MGDFILIIKISRARSGIALVPLPYSSHSHSRLLHTPLTSRFVTPPAIWAYFGKITLALRNLAKFTVVTELLPWLGPASSSRPNLPSPVHH